MKKNYFLIIIAFWALPSQGQYITPEVTYFPLNRITILDPEFKHFQQKGKDYLLWLEPDSLLHFYRIEAGLKPKAGPYAGWESQDVWGTGPLRGGYLGYYLSALSMMYQATGDPLILKRLSYTLKELEICRQAGKDGFLLGLKDGRKLFKQVAAGNIKSNNPTLNGAWAPLYLINKMMLGLGEAYQGCKLKEALPLLTGLADWFGTEVLDHLNDDQIQKMLVCEHGSINESYVLTYALTGNSKYLAWAKRLHDAAMWLPLSKGEDILFGWHANTQIPKFTGFYKYYTYTGDKQFATAAYNFWNIVTLNHTWVIGGNSTGEHFFPKEEFAKRVLLKGGPETCNSVNMLRLTEALFCYQPDAHKADFYEKILLNHIMSAHEPVHGMPCYFTSMRPGHYRIYASRDSSFWCCGQTGLESPAKLGKFIYTQKGNDVMVNLFISSSLDWKEKGIKVIQNSELPQSGKIRIQLSFDHPEKIKLFIRKPWWASQTTFYINRKRVEPVCDTYGYWIIEEKWKKENTVEIDIPLNVSTETLPGSDEFVSLLYGPYVLGGKLGNENPPQSYWSQMANTAEKEIDWTKIPAFNIPANSIAACVKKTEGKPLQFQIVQNNFPDTLRLEPFYRLHFQRYAIYWKINKSTY